MENRLISSGVHFVSRSRLVPALERREARRAGRLPILVYHRIGDPAAEEGLLDPSLLSATPAQFSEQMQFLSTSYHPLALGELLGYIEAGEPLPGGAVLVTFDDGYRNFYDTAWPILERFHVPAVMSLATEYIDQPGRLFWWDRLYQAVTRTRHTSLSLPQTGELSLANKAERWTAFCRLKQLYSSLEDGRAHELLDQVLGKLGVEPITHGLVMSWSEARELQAHGCALAAHTRSHPILARIPAERALAEICTSQQDILRETGSSWPVTVYPSGHSQDCNTELEPLLRQAGFVLGLSSIPGINTIPGSNLLRLKRIGLSPWVNLPEFRMVLTDIYRLYCTLLHQD